MHKIAWLAPLLAIALYAGDVSGRWAGVIQICDSASGTTMDAPVHAEFVQKANEISGKIGRKGDQQSESIRNGRLEGNRVVFEVASAETASAMKFELTMDGDRLEGMMKGAVETGPISGRVHLTRDKGK